MACILAILAIMPKRLSSYLLAILLLALLAVTYYLTRAVNSPELQKAIEKKKGQVSSSNPPAVPLSSVSSQTPAPPPIDPANMEKAVRLNSPESTVTEDLQIVHEFVELYRRAFGSNPVGLNEDITAALTGTADPSRPGRLFPPSSPAVRNGQLVDRWGTPFWFHPESGTKMEVRSAGPDKELFTADDVILAQ